jgi:hypothetical protein
MGLEKDNTAMKMLLNEAGKHTYHLAAQFFNDRKVTYVLALSYAEYFFNCISFPCLFCPQPGWL